MNKRFVRKLQLIFIALIMVGLLVPLVGMTVAKTDSSSENRTLATWPHLFVDKKINENFLSEAGAYFEDHYAFKEALVTLDTRFNVSLFQNAESEEVIIGTGEWLYYSATAEDYTGISHMSGKQLATLAYNISLLKQYVEQHGAKFLVTLPPNKNTVYPDYMPDKFLRATSPNNIERFEYYADQAGLLYVNLTDKLVKASVQSGPELYFKRDTHWNAYGAAIAYDALLDATHTPHQTISEESLIYEPFMGDLWPMLYPGDPSTLEAPCGIKVDENMFTKKRNDTLQTTQITNNDPNVAGKLMIVGDSFTWNYLLYELCTAFDTTTYADRYAINDIEQIFNSSTADLFIFECVERHVPSLANDMSQNMVFSSLEPEIDAKELTTDSQDISQISITMDNRGGHLQLSGLYDSPDLTEEDILQSLLVLVIRTPNGQREAYLPYRTDPASDKGGFVAYFANDRSFEPGTTVELYQVSENTSSAIAATVISD